MDGRRGLRVPQRGSWEQRLEAFTSEPGHTPYRSCPERCFPVFKKVAAKGRCVLFVKEDSLR